MSTPTISNELPRSAFDGLQKTGDLLEFYFKETEVIGRTLLCPVCNSQDFRLISVHDHNHWHAYCKTCQNLVSQDNCIFSTPCYKIEKVK